jgi:3-hydroxyisobutyrate dehydrogenase-like beta-hydroxyacid dehydrogenase
VYDFGADAGAGNVVKLCGNFLIACSIESIAEALALAESNGLDRKKVGELSSPRVPARAGGGRNVVSVCGVGR